MVDASVLSIVSSNNVEIFRHLGAVQLKRTSLQHRVGSDIDELRKLILEHRPTLVILDALLPTGSGYALCREIKDHPELKHTHVIILLGSVMSMEELKKTSESGCDDVLALPLHADDFYCHLAQITGVLLRSSTRIPVEMEVGLVRGEEKITGRVINVSNNGLGLQFDRQVTLGAAEVSVMHGEEEYEGIAAEVVWCHENQRGYAVGLRFLRVPPLARGLLARLSLYQITENSNGEGITAILQGGFDEQTDFGPLFAKLAKVDFIDFMMQGVSYLSSSGVRSWCLFLNKLPAETTYTFRNCSLAFASQAAMVPMVVGRGRVLSVQAPYFCDTCDREETRLIESALVKQEDGSFNAPPVHCHICSSQLTFDDLPERYFAFLADS